MSFSSTIALLSRAVLVAGTLAALAPVRPALAADNGIPEVLKTIPRATGVCHKNDGPGGILPTAANTPADLGCATSAAALQQRPGALLVDVRQRSDYGSYHIDAALNASLGDLHGKPYWRAKPIVLVGSGKAERELYMECSRLKQQGYRDVAVLRGGLASWIAAGQPLAGHAPSLAEATRLTPDEFWQESQDPDNLVLLSKEQVALQDEVPFAMVLPRIVLADVRAILERRRKDMKNAPLAAVVLAIDAAAPQGEVEALQRALLPVPVLVYREGRSALTRQVALQKAVWLAQARGPKQAACGQ